MILNTGRRGGRRHVDVHLEPLPEWYSWSRPDYNAGLDPSACFATQGPSTILGIIFMVSSRTVSFRNRILRALRRCFSRSPDSVFRAAQ